MNKRKLKRGRRKHQKVDLRHLKVNRQYKDRVFRLAFKEKKDALALYNALNGTNYQDENKLEVTTLEDAVYLSMKNDVSFLIGGMMNLYEHQSSYNPNMPVRGLLYFARLYEQYIESRNLNIYGTTLQPLPVPNYIIFYNGTKEEPDKSILRLSDAFKLAGMNQKPCLECTTTMLNINYGHNRELLNKCRRLEEYSLFVETVREHCRKENDLDLAVSGAVEECIQKDVLKDILIKNRAEVMDVVLSCSKEKYERMIRDEEFRRGEQKGERKGEQKLGRLIQCLLQEKKYDEIQRVTEDSEHREQLYQEYHIVDVPMNDKEE